MGLARKGSRKIHVENTDYRWVVSPDDGFMRIVIERWEMPGQRVSIQIGYRDEQSSSGSSIQRERITPALIRQIILKAPSFGWTPGERGKEICLTLENDDLLPLKDS
jgi:hypothetical protein